VITLEGNEDGEIDCTTASRFLKAMTILENKAGCEEITVLLNSPGGEWYHGMAIYGKILACEKYVNVLVFGHAMSMASVILQAGDRRLLHPDAMLMIHDGTDFAEGHPRKVERQAAEIKRVRMQMYEIYLRRIREKHADYRLNDIVKRCDHDSYLTAQQAIDLGLADGLIE
jgi:ATP-dependent Clp endopeptidase proteolytic subunit ClpP